MSNARTARTLAAVLGVSLALVAAPVRAATAPELLCVQQAKADLTSCVGELTALRAQCAAAYQAAVPPCFGANAPCASTCISDKESCESAPEQRRDACNGACDQHATTLQADCRAKRGPAVQACLLRAKLLSIKCKQKCVRRVTLPLQRCSTQLGGCLKSCVAR